MIGLYHPLILVAVIIGGRADAVPELTRRDGDPVPVDGQIGVSGSSSVNVSIDAQLSAESVAGGANKYQRLQGLNGFPFGSNVAVKLLGAEANAIADYDEEGQFNGGSTYDEYNLEPPYGGFGFGNQFMTAAKASASVEVQTVEKIKPDLNGYEVTRSPNWNLYQKENANKSLLKTGVVSPNGHMNIKNWYPFTRPAEGEAFVQANAEIQSVAKAKAETATQDNSKFQYHEETRANSVVQTSKALEVTIADEGAKTYTGYGGEYNVETQPYLIGQITTGSQYETSTDADVEVQSNGGFQYREENKVNSSIKTDAQANIASSYSGGSPHNWGAHYLAAAQTSGGTKKYGRAEINDPGPLANGYEVTPSLYWNQYQKGIPKKISGPTDIVSPNGHNNITKWYPYTRPAEGETFVHVDRQIQNNGQAQAGTAAQGNGKSQYQADTQANSMVQTGKGFKVTVANADVVTKTYTGYGADNIETEPYLIDQINSGNKYEPFYPIRRNNSLNDGFYYSGENKLSSSAKADAQAQTNIASSHSGGSLHNWGAHYLAAAQTSKGIKDGGAPISDSEPMVNRYEVTHSPNWNLYQTEKSKKSLVQIDIVSPNGHNNINNWNPYSKPAQGESFVQADGKIQSGGKAESLTAAHGNGKSQYQEETLANSVVQTSKGLKVTVANADTAANKYTGYGEQYNAKTQPNSIGQINTGNQYGPFYTMRRNSTFNGEFHYSGENKLSSSAKADAQAQTNIASSYTGGSPHNWGAHYLASTQTSKKIKYGDAPNIDRAIYGNTNKYNSGNGEEFQANAKSHIENGAQFSAAEGTATVVQGGAIIDARFGETKHPSHRPQPHYRFRRPRSGRNYG